MKNMLQKSLSQLSKKRLQTIRRSLIISVPAVLCTAVMISPTIPLVTKGFKALSNIANSVVGIPFESSFEADETPVAKSDICTDVVGFSELSTKISDKGPTKATMSGSSLQGEGFNIADEVGFTGLKTFKYQGNVAEIARNSQKRFTATIFGTDQLIGNNTVQVADDFSLSYKIFPSLGTDGANPHKADNNYASSYVSLDLLYNDSATDTDNLLKLSNLGLKDQYGYGITPREQGNAKVLYSAQ
jgi:hypothetical protein